MASVILTSAATKQLKALGVVPVTRIRKLVDRLKDWPAVAGVKPLRGNLAGHYRLRTGDYRVQFHVSGDVVTIEKIGHRDRFYDD